MRPAMMTRGRTRPARVTTILLFALPLLGLLVMIPTSAEAQRKDGFISYMWSTPISDLQNYVDNDSWIGFALEGNRHISEKASIGLYLGWNEFYERTKEVIDIPFGAIQGDQYRDVNSFPILAQLKVYGGVAGAKRPFAGLGAGVYYLHQVMDIGVSTFDTDNWIFGVAPQLGLQIPLRGYGKMAQISVRYNYPLNAGSFLSGDSRSMQYLSVSLGVGGLK